MERWRRSWRCHRSSVQILELRCGAHVTLYDANLVLAIKLLEAGTSESSRTAPGAFALDDDLLKDLLHRVAVVLYYEQGCSGQSTCNGRCEVPPKERARGASHPAQVCQLLFLGDAFMFGMSSTIEERVSMEWSHTVARAYHASAED